MADFCKECATELFGDTSGDFRGITLLKDWMEGKACTVLCEDCGPIQVDPEGRCVSKNCLKAPAHKGHETWVKYSPITGKPINGT